MSDLQKTRFLAANYANLQALHAVPLGLFLLIVVVWANAQTGPASELGLPLIAAVVVFFIIRWIRGYYRARFGVVESPPAQKRLELVLGLLGGAVALAAFFADTGLDLPFSCIGLVFAAAFVVEYWRMHRAAPGRYLLPNTIAFTVLMVLLSLLPLFGLAGWWGWLGLHSQLLGVLAAAGLVIAVAGLLGHWCFIRLLPAAEA
jgi:hypothetical protein